MSLDFAPIDDHVLRIVQHAQAQYDQARGTFARLVAQEPSTIVHCAQGWVRVNPICHKGKFLPNHVNMEIDKHDFDHEEDFLVRYRDPERAASERRRYYVVPLDIVATIVARRGGLKC